MDASWAEEADVEDRGNTSHLLGAHDDSNENTQLLKELHEKLSHARERADNYFSLCAFMAFSILYAVILFLQADSGLAYRIITAHTTLLPPSYTGNSPVVFPNAPTDVISWINDSIVQNVWGAPPCGDGVCSTPAEYPAFGAFGCLADCGTFQNLTTILITLSNSFPSDVERSSSTWNLKMVAPYPITWFANDQQFGELVHINNETLLQVPDGDWELVLNAPYGGVKGQILRSVNSTSSFFSTPNTTIQSETLLKAFGGCLPDQGSFAKCLNVSAAIAAYIVASCPYGPLSNSTRAQLYSDWSNLCTTDPEVVFKLVNYTSGNFSSTRAYFDLLGPQTFATGDFFLPCGLAPSSSALSTSALSLSSSSATDTAPSPSPSAPSPAPAPSSLDDTLNLFAGLSAPSSLWDSLGAEDATRFDTIQVVYQRAVQTWTIDPCFAYQIDKHNDNSPLADWVGLFMGAPAKYFNYTGTTAGENLGQDLTSSQDLAVELYFLHYGASIGQDAMDRFLNTLLSAFYSATTMTEDTKHAFFSWFHALDRVIVTEGLYAGKTCDEADYVLEWGTGSKLTTIIDSVPSRGYVLVQWTWIDDNPHSLYLRSVVDSTGVAFTYHYGYDSASYFNGFGGGLSIISRTTKCTPENRYVDPYDPTTLVPCVLETPNQPAGTFTYTTVISSLVAVQYQSEGLADASNQGNITFTKTAQLELSNGNNNTNQIDNGSGLSFYCSSDTTNTCTLQYLANGVCNAECNNPDCLFDGGDCSCPVDVNGLSQCACLGNQTRAAPDGSCCFGDAVGLSLSFPFSIQTYGKNYLLSDAPFLPSGPATLKRTVANQNVALIGLHISTKRGASINCSSETRFKDITTDVTCQGAESDDFWGVASPYIKGAQLYNSSLELGPSGKAPPGFYVANVMNVDNSAHNYGKNYIVDISLNLQEATNLVQYIMDGYFYDGQTTSSNVELITYNVIEKYFTFTKVELTFQTGGKVAAACSVNTVKVGLYRQARDWIRFALEILFGAALLWTIFKEIVQFLKSEKLAYFQDIWSYMDVISDAIMAAGVGMWIYHVVGQANDFQAHVKYNIYRTLPGDFFQLLTPADGDYKSTSELGEALKVFKNVDDMISLNKIYFSLQGINCFLMVLRVLKFMNFQPRMGVITRTLAKAANSLFHFLILISVMFLGYALFGYIAFGQYLEQFRSIPVALNTLLNAVNGDDNPDFFFVQFTGWLLVAAYLYWWSFIVLVFYSTLNVLIAIIVDAHTEVAVSTFTIGSHFPPNPSIPCAIMTRLAPHCVERPNANMDSTQVHVEVVSPALTFKFSLETEAGTLYVNKPKTKG
eukprot:TRINITY_DN163_c0_g1_i3.p1 TRINITY_DN163_c0_g1~~TRINITY_DN163_c0_g1_i3.p1  ORF type:complete len:1325 (-),score=113.59 TRINITY_DN163_c0_g1_i3:2581-6555(-)